MNTVDASALIKDICGNLSIAAKSVENTDYTVVLRGDSTLRGHFPKEADAAVSLLGEMDAWIICPFFLQGGRYTIKDIHYVADSDWLVPAGDTEFARDASFGYKSSNLHEWVEEKTRGRIPASSVSSISIDLLRKGGPDAVCDTLCNLQKAELRGKSFLCRTAASFVSTRIGIIPKAPILPKDLGINKERKGGLIVVGSYVPKTTKQGGITSSDLATKALEAKCAKVVGQALAGIPLWQLGPESSHPGVPYIVFPGNVGDSKALADVVKSWALPSRLSSTKVLLVRAEAVVAAAEEENSPAILQIHPSALKQGGIPM
ncbi:d-tagatose-1 bisphosphate aldolase [Salix suchowensis]|nr:d-tagatose-1 bisphosphate aldolase [Salix suchowensis]